MNKLQTTKERNEKSRYLKNVQNRLRLFPNDVKLRQEKEILENSIKEF
jgi:hypothetical protein